MDKSWTFEQAIEANERALADNPDLPSRLQPLSVWQALQDLEALRDRFKAGEQYALMLAIRKCANHDLPLPSWAAESYITAFDRVHNMRERSWDAAFGRPLPKGKHLHDLRTNRQYRHAVFNSVREILGRKPDTPIDDQLFERVANDFPFEKTKAKELYYSVANTRPRKR